MFLSYLNEVNKEGFLKLCVHAALSDNNFAEEESEVIAAYCREMDLNVHQPEVCESFQDLVKELNNSTTKKEKNIISFILKREIRLGAKNFYRRSL